MAVCLYHSWHFAIRRKNRKDIGLSGFFVRLYKFRITFTVPSVPSAIPAVTKYMPAG